MPAFQFPPVTRTAQLTGTCHPQVDSDEDVGKEDSTDDEDDEEGRGQEDDAEPNSSSKPDDKDDKPDSGGGGGAASSSSGSGECAPLWKLVLDFHNLAQGLAEVSAHMHYAMKHHRGLPAFKQLCASTLLSDSQPEVQNSLRWVASQWQ